MKILNYKILNFLLIVTLFNLGGCNENKVVEDTASLNSEIGNSPSNPDENKLNLTVSILPQKYFVEKIGGELVTVNVMVGAGVSAETYEPLAQQLANLSKSSAYISIGVPFEQAWLEKIKSANPDISIVNSSEGIDKIPMIGHDHHDHGHDDEHSHQKDDHEEEKESLDPHVWLSPQLAKIQAQNIYQELVKLDAKNEAIYQQNLAKFLTEIDELDKQITEKFASINQRKFLIYHPAWAYFAQDYDLQQTSIELEGQEATSGELADLITQAKEDNIRVVFADSQFPSKTVDTFAREINGEVILLNPLAENWSENLLQVTDKLAQSMKDETSN